MLRHSGWFALALCAFASSASAEKITVEQGFRSSGSELALHVLEPSFQEAVIAAAPEWRETRGADVWRVSLEGVDLRVQVFPTLHRPGAGQPNCCVFFEFGDTEFWLKILGASPASGLGSLPGSPSEGLEPGDGSELNGVSTPPPNPPSWSKAPAAVEPGPGESSVGGPPASGPNPPSTGGVAAGPVDSGHQESIPPSVEDGPGAVGGIATSLPEIPEPSLLLLMGLGVAAVAKRVGRAVAGSR